MDALVRLLLRQLVEKNVIDATDPNIQDTPNRVSFWIRDYFVDRVAVRETLKRLFNAKFPSKYDEMVVVKNIHTFGMCPHHLLPVELRISVGYVPEGHALGLSKIARVAKLLSHGLVLQEQLCMDIADAFERHLGTSTVAVHIYGRHLCMLMRGVEEKEAVTITTTMRGAFKKDPRTRSEFLALIGCGHDQHV